MLVTVYLFSFKGSSPVSELRAQQYVSTGVWLDGAYIWLVIFILYTSNPLKDRIAQSSSSDTFPRASSCRELFPGSVRDKEKGLCYAIMATSSLISSLYLYMSMKNPFQQSPGIVLFPNWSWILRNLPNDLSCSRVIRKTQVDQVNYFPSREV